MGIMTRLTMLAGVFLVSGMNVHGAMLPGSKAKEWAANPKKHVVELKRVTTNDVEKKMIAAAESAVPSSNCWWIKQEGGDPLMRGNVKLPFAITKDALDYYAKQVERYKKGTYRAYSEPSSRLNYKASVAHHDAFTLSQKAYKGVYVVSMTMQFNAMFVEDSTMGLQVSKNRTVVLDAAGKILAVDGDNTAWGAQLAL